MSNLLLKGENIDCLNYLKRNMKLSNKIDLVYIDPPFATGGSFKISGDRATTISNSSSGTTAYDDKLVGKEYLDFLKKRLAIIKSLLSDEGSIYLHIDYKIGHYVKILMDKVFGQKNFRNDITRIKCNPKNFSRKGYGNIKDLILFYSKSENYIWNDIRMPRTKDEIKKGYPKIDEDGRRYTTVPIHAPGESKSGESSKKFKGICPPPGRHWRTNIETLEQWDKDGLIEWSSTGNPRKKNYADEMRDKKIQDIWEFKDPQYPKYPTEKNLDMLNLIVKNSSNQNSIVLDCFCGSGSTLHAAALNGRKWIGIDKSESAIKITKDQITNEFKENNEFDFIDLQKNPN